MLTSDLHSLPTRRNAGPHVWNAIHLHQAVRATGGNAKKPAPPVVFETPAEGPHTGRVKGGRYRLSFKALYRPSSVEEVNPFFTLDPLRRMRRQARLTHFECSSARNDPWTSLVRRSRTTRNQVRQPRR